jgi:hypothetical protein
MMPYRTPERHGAFRGTPGRHGAFHGTPGRIALSGVCTELAPGVLKLGHDREETAGGGVE